MGKAVRAIIIKDNQLLLIEREKDNSKYYTLVGGKVLDGETDEEALTRKVREETGLIIHFSKLTFIEQHPEPYNQQYIYLCETNNSQQVALNKNSEEAYLNRFGANIHLPVWVSRSSLSSLPFRTPQLKEGIINGLKHGFPTTPKIL